MQEAKAVTQQQDETTAVKGDTSLTKVQRDFVKEGSAQPGLFKTISSAAAKLLHPGGDTEQQPSPDLEERTAERAQHGSGRNGIPTAEETGAESGQVPVTRAEHAGVRSAVHDAEKRSTAGR